MTDPHATRARILELAIIGANVAHFAGYDLGNESGHTEINPARCPHPQCVAVRAPAEPSETLVTQYRSMAAEILSLRAALLAAQRSGSSPRTEGAIDG